MEKHFLTELDETCFLAFSDIAEKAIVKKVDYYNQSAFLVEKSFKKYPDLKLYFLVEALNSGLQINLQSFYPYQKEISYPESDFYKQPEYGLFAESFSAQIQFFTSSFSLPAHQKEITRIFFRVVGDENPELYYFELAMDFTGIAINVFNQEEKNMTIQEIDYKALYEQAQRQIQDVNYRIYFERELQKKGLEASPKQINQLIDFEFKIEEQKDKIYNFFSDLKKDKAEAFAQIFSEFQKLLELRSDETQALRDIGLGPIEKNEEEEELFTVVDWLDWR